MKQMHLGLSLFFVAGLVAPGCAEPLIESNDETETGTGDGDGDTVGDGDGDTVGDGDGDTGEPVCGDGMMEGAEECDDGNDVDDDSCTNACTLPVCGDGIIQAGEGETCDDGNDQSGDACTATCVDAGTVVWEDFYDLNGGSTDIGYEVEIDGGDNINVLVRRDASYKIYEFDGDGTESWDFNALNTNEPSLAIGPMDQLVVGGFVNATGQTRQFDGDGTYQWYEPVPHNPSEILAVAVDDEGFVVSAGIETEGMDPSAVLMRMAGGDGTTDWVHNEINGGAFGPVAVGTAGQIYVWRELVLESYDSDGTFLWASDPHSADDYRAIALDIANNSYVVAIDQSGESYTLRKFDGDGMGLWAEVHDDADVLEGGHGVAVLPGGGALVAGFTNDLGVFEADGLLSWYTADGDPFLDLVLDGPDDDDREILYDVAVDEEGGYAVAVGSREAAGETDLWIRKFAI